MSNTVFVIGRSWDSIDEFMRGHHEGRWERIVLQGVPLRHAVERLASFGRPVVHALDDCLRDPLWDEVHRQLTSQGVTWMRS